MHSRQGHHPAVALDRQHRADAEGVRRRGAADDEGCRRSRPANGGGSRWRRRSRSTPARPAARGPRSTRAGGRCVRTGRSSRQPGRRGARCPRPLPRTPGRPRSRPGRPGRRRAGSRWPAPRPGDGPPARAGAGSGSGPAAPSGPGPGNRRTRCTHARVPSTRTAPSDSSSSSMPGNQPTSRSRPADSKEVQVTPLGHVPPRHGGVVEPLPLQHDDVVDVVGQRSRGQQPRDAGPDDDRGRHPAIGVHGATVAPTRLRDPAAPTSGRGPGRLPEDVREPIGRFDGTRRRDSRPGGAERPRPRRGDRGG